MGDSFRAGFKDGLGNDLRAKGPASHQPGASPQEWQRRAPRGLKARSIPPVVTWWESVAGCHQFWPVRDRGAAEGLGALPQAKWLTTTPADFSAKLIPGWQAIYSSAQNQTNQPCEVW